MAEQLPGYILRYWGKAGLGDEWHPAAYHLLDVAAAAQGVLEALPALHRRCDSMAPGLAARLPVLAALHDLGKFSVPFQSLRADLADVMGAGDAADWRGAYIHHGDVAPVMAERLTAIEEGLAATGWDAATWNTLLLASFGHHGKPPAVPEWPMDDSDLFLDGSGEDVLALTAELLTLLAPTDAPPPPSPDQAAAASWLVAGILVLADWIGSNRDWFPYHRPTLSLADYWHGVARPNAAKAIAATGLGPVRPAPAPSFAGLTGGGWRPSPLQALCESVGLAAGPQIFVIEDVTGAGKTEAALLLSWRLMAAGLADGLYFGLPTQATANAMFARLGASAGNLFAPDHPPTLGLAHGKAWVQGWRDAALAPGGGLEAEDEGENQAPTATLAAANWLADNGKKALLTDLGAGTLDQALLAVLPARHQSLRLLGLTGSVLIADEVHAYDGYTFHLLKALLGIHALMGGSAIILSATLPQEQRRGLIDAFAAGLGHAPAHGADLPPYPLVSHWGAGGAEVREMAPAGEPPNRILRCQRLEDEAAAIRAIMDWAAQGKCAVWIRNTVEDARRAHAALAQGGMDAGHLILFHAAFAPLDRLAVEERVTALFGRHGDAAARAGKVLVATQVVEQSLDLDFDEMISDLAPIDLMIQRAGRQHRHARPGRGSPVLHVLGPRPDADAGRDWYARALPKAAKVYPDAARLWLTQSLLTGALARAAGWHLVTDARALIEAVYGPQAEETVPPALLDTLLTTEGDAYGKADLARRCVLDFRRAYGEPETWVEDIRARTRLGEERLPLILAVAEGATLRPWAARGLPPAADPMAERALWSLSELSLAPWQANGEDIPRSWRAPIAALRRRMGWDDSRPLLAILSPAANGAWTATACRDGKTVPLTYHPDTGLHVGTGTPSPA